MDAARLKAFGTTYTAAWCSGEAAAVAAFYGDNGSLTINEGTPAVGRTAITAAAQGFMTAFPDMVVVMDDVSLQDDHAAIAGPSSARIQALEVQARPSGSVDTRNGRSSRTA
jgi:uncharacterized protein (TIGR02246 family)